VEVGLRFIGTTSQDDVFALKGGTAINLFLRDMPRLSVDLDLVFPDYSLPRDKALARINEAIRQSAERLNARGFQSRSAPCVAGGFLRRQARRAIDRQHPRDHST